MHSLLCYHVGSPGLRFHDMPARRLCSYYTLAGARLQGIEGSFQELFSLMPSAVLLHGRGGVRDVVEELWIIALAKTNVEVLRELELEEAGSGKRAARLNRVLQTEMRQKERENTSRWPYRCSHRPARDAPSSTVQRSMPIERESRPASSERA